MIKANNLIILGLGVVMSIIGSCLPAINISNTPLAMFVGIFLNTGSDTSCFTLFNWYVMVAIGMVFGDILIRCKNLNKLYMITLLITAPLMIVYLTLSIIYGCCFMSINYSYYALSLADALGLLTIDFAAISLFYFIFKNIKNEKVIKPITIMSVNLNAIYCIHWVILGFLTFLLIGIYKKEIPYWFSYTISIPIIIASTLLADIYKLIKRKAIDYYQIKHAVK